MITIEETARTVELQGDDFVIDDAQRAAVAFPARFSRRTLDAYRHALRGYPVGGRRRTRRFWRRPVRTSSAMGSSPTG